MPRPSLKLGTHRYSHERPLLTATEVTVFPFLPCGCVCGWVCVSMCVCVCVCVWVCVSVKEGLISLSSFLSTKIKISLQPHSAWETMQITLYKNWISAHTHTHTKHHDTDERNQTPVLPSATASAQRISSELWRGQPGSTATNSQPSLSSALYDTHTNVYSSPQSLSLFPLSSLCLCLFLSHPLSLSQALSLKAGNVQHSFQWRWSPSHKITFWLCLILVWPT